MTLLRDAKVEAQCGCGQKINNTNRTNYTDSIYRFIVGVALFSFVSFQEVSFKFNDKYFPSWEHLSLS